MATRDGTWEVDLIWKYFQETSTFGSPTEDWYKKMDSAGSLDNRKHVYDLLVSDPAHTNPSVAQLPTSMIPWNQLNAGIVEVFHSEYACGSVVKLAFRKYMGWGRGEPPQRSVGHRGWHAVSWLVKSLKAGMPARVYLKQKDHYVGLVGFRGKSVHREAPPGDAYKQYEFLCIDPWPGGAATGATTILYAGAHTKFLGVARQVGTKIMYDGFEITALEGYHPF